MLPHGWRVPDVALSIESLGLVAIVSVYEENDEKQQEEEGNQNNSLVDQVENPVEIDNQLVENHEQNENDLNDLENIFEPKRKDNSKGSQDAHLDNLAEFLDGFDDDELENFLWYNCLIFYVFEMYVEMFTSSWHEFIENNNEEK